MPRWRGFRGEVPAVVAAVYDWSGFYIGLNGGGGWNRSCWTNTALFGVTLPSTSEGCLTGSGGTAGGQVGQLWEAEHRGRPSRPSLAIRKLGVRRGGAGHLAGLKRHPREPRLSARHQPDEGRRI